MIAPSRELIEKLFKKYPKAKQGKILDVGSLDVNGNMKSLFDGMEYMGIDFRDGPNVDMVLNGHNLIKQFGKESFDLVICFDTLEHDDKFWETVDNMRGVLKKGGFLVIGAPSLNHPRHNHPYDYYRFFATALKVFLRGYKKVHVEEQCYFGQNSNVPDQVYGWGQKP